MARAIGVDIGERFLKVVELSGSARSFRVQRIAIREIPGSNGQHADDGATDLTDDLVIEESGELTHVEEEAQPQMTRAERISECIADVFRELKLPKEDVCASFPAHVSVNREIQVPFFEDDQIRKVVRFEAENHLHSHSIDDVVVNWIKTGETKDGSRLTIFASPKQELAERLALLRRARVDPAAIDLDATALYTTLDACNVFADNPNCIVVDIGASSTTLIMLVDGRPRVVRCFRLGVGSLEDQVGEELGVTAAESASEMHRLSDDGSGDLLVPAASLTTPDSETDKSLSQLETDVVTDGRTHFVTKLHREAVRSLASVSTDSPPDKILLLGGGALVPGVPEALSERFGLPAEQLDLLEHLDSKDRGQDPALTGATIGTAVGCGLRMLGRNPFGVELLQEEFAPRNVFEVVRTMLATAITLLFLVIGIWTYAIKEELKAERVKYNDMAAVVELMTFKAELAYLQGIGDPPGKVKTKDVAQKLARTRVRSFPRDEKRINRMRSLLMTRFRFLQERLGLRSDIPQLPSAVKCMYEIYSALSSVPREQLGTYFQITEMIVQERQATVKIVLDNREVFDTVRRLFSQSPYFKDRARDQTKVVDPGAEQTVDGGSRYRQNFTFKFRDD